MHALGFEQNLQNLTSLSEIVNYDIICSFVLLNRTLGFFLCFLNSSVKYFPLHLGV